VLLAPLAVPVLTQGPQKPTATDPFDSTAAVIGASIGASLNAIADEIARGQQRSEELSLRVAAARKEFWSQYPNGPRLAEAEKAFASALMSKDWTMAGSYLLLPEGCADSRAALFNTVTGIAMIDGGIPSDARIGFCSWINAMKKIRRTSGDLAALRAGVELPEYEAYKRDRDWAEFVRAGKASGKRPRGASERVLILEDLEHSSDPERFAHFMLWNMTPYGDNVGDHPGRGESFEADYAATKDTFQALAKFHGRDKLLAAARRILSAPKVRRAGNDVLADPAAVGCGSSMLRPCYWELVPFLPLPPEQVAYLQQMPVRQACYDWGSQWALDNGKSQTEIGALSRASVNYCNCVAPHLFDGGDSAALIANFGSAFERVRGEPRYAAMNQACSLPQPSATAPAPAARGANPRAAAPQRTEPPVPPTAAQREAIAEAERQKALAAEAAARRAEQCNRIPPMLEEAAAKQREFREANAKLQQGIAEYRRTLAQQRVPQRERNALIAAKRKELSATLGIDALTARINELTVAVREAQAACRAR
jgi:hypothetical protein